MHFLTADLLLAHFGGAFFVPEVQVPIGQLQHFEGGSLLVDRLLVQVVDIIVIRNKTRFASQDLPNVFRLVHCFEVVLDLFRIAEWNDVGAYKVFGDWQSQRVLCHEREEGLDHGVAHGGGILIGAPTERQGSQPLRVDLIFDHQAQVADSGQAALTGEEAFKFVDYYVIVAKGKTLDQIFEYKVESSGYVVFPLLEVLPHQLLNLAGLKRAEVDDLRDKGLEARDGRKKNEHDPRPPHFY